MIFVLSLPFGGRCSHSFSPRGWLHVGMSSAVPEEVRICNFPLLLLIKYQHSGDLQECLFPLLPLGPKKALFLISLLGIYTRESNLGKIVSKKGSTKSRICITTWLPFRLVLFSILHPRHLFPATDQY